MEKKLEIGEIVTLNSEGENMTVSSLNGDDVTCVWMDKSGNSQEAVFKSQLLKRVAKKTTQVVKLSGL